jgi:hypothetical protein
MRVALSTSAGLNELEVVVVKVYSISQHWNVATTWGV